MTIPLNDEGCKYLFIWLIYFVKRNFFEIMFCCLNYRFGMFFYATYLLKIVQVGFNGLK